MTFGVCGKGWGFKRSRLNCEIIPRDLRAIPSPLDSSPVPAVSRQPHTLRTYCYLLSLVLKCQFLPRLAAASCIVCFSNCLPETWDTVPQHLLGAVLLHLQTLFCNFFFVVVAMTVKKTLTTVKPPVLQPLSVMVTSTDPQCLWNPSGCIYLLPSMFRSLMLCETGYFSVSYLAYWRINNISDNHIATYTPLQISSQTSSG